MLRLRAFDAHVPAAVVPLPVHSAVFVTPSSASPPAASVASVTVLGFVYPGKGHEEVQSAIADALPGATLTCVGEASLGHDDLVRGLIASSTTTVTGFVPNGELAAYLLAPTIPVAPHRLVSASGSICTWWSHRRRPIAPRCDYTCEPLERNPGSLILYDTDLGTALLRAKADPSTTWLASDVHPGPSVTTAVRLRGSIIDEWVR